MIGFTAIDSGDPVTERHGFIHHETEEVWSCRPSSQASELHCKAISKTTDQLLTYSSGQRANRRLTGSGPCPGSNKDKRNNHGAHRVNPPGDFRTCCVGEDTETIDEQICVAEDRHQRVVQDYSAWRWATDHCGDLPKVPVSRGRFFVRLYFGYNERLPTHLNLRAHVSNREAVHEESEFRRECNRNCNCGRTDTILADSAFYPFFRIVISPRLTYGNFHHRPLRSLELGWIRRSE